MESLGFAHFLAQTDAVGKVVLALLFALSVASWYLIVTKSVRGWLARRRAGAFLDRFWDAESIEQAMQLAARAAPDDAFAALAREAHAAASNARSRSYSRDGDSASGGKVTLVYLLLKQRQELPVVSAMATASR
jgi:biopolymer transport protein ExbB